MGWASWLSNNSMAIQCIPSSHTERLFVGYPFKPANLILPCRPSPRSTIAFFARRRKSSSAITSSSSSKKKKHSLPHSDAGKDDDLGEDAFEALFKQLEEDLRNDDPSIDDGDDEISEEDLAKLELELAEALGDDDIEISNSTEDEIGSGNDTKEDDDEEEEEEPVKLKNWQLRRLATALKAGRRKTSIKSLAAELCLDRAVVLEFLRDPPPNLLMLSAALPDEPAPTMSMPEIKPIEIVPEETTEGDAEPDTKVKVPVHVMQHRWSTQKRLKKIQVETLERVYNRTKRPTNAMISSIVQVTNLPRKRVVKWFEDKRTEDGVPDNRLPYQRSVPETVFSH